MKSFFITTFILFTTLAHATCDKKIDSSRIILFIDTNNSEPEIATAQKAACQRGEKLVVVPKNYNDYTPLIRNVTKAREKYYKCLVSGCPESIQQEYTKASSEYDQFRKAQPEHQEAIKDALKEAKASDAKISSLIISGHDGGGYFSGEKGRFSRNDMKEIMKDFSDHNQVSSVLLLGCYTGVQKEIMEWKGIFPEVRLIGGYDGSAPLSDKPLGHSYLSDLLLKEKGLLKQADEKALLNYTRSNFQALGQLNAAVYLECNAETSSDPQAYYYASKLKEKNFAKLDMSDCMMNAALPKIESMYSKYLSGELEPPKDTVNGELRSIYNKARTFEHCIQETRSNINVNNIFNLLFYEAVKKNFADYYQNDLEEVEKKFKELTLEDIEKNVNETVNMMERSVKTMEDSLNEIKKDPEAYLKKLEQEQSELKKRMESLTQKKDDASFREYVTLKWNLESKDREITDFKKSSGNFIEKKEFELQLQKKLISSHKSQLESFKEKPDLLKTVWIPTKKNLESKSRKELLENQHNLNKLLMIPGIPNDQGQNLRWVNRATAHHLQYFQNPFNWHEFTGKAEAPEIPVLRNEPYTNGVGVGYGGGYGVSTGHGIGTIIQNSNNALSSPASGY